MQSDSESSIEDDLASNMSFDAGSSPKQSQSDEESNEDDDDEESGEQEQEEASDSESSIEDDIDPAAIALKRSQNYGSSDAESDSAMMEEESGEEQMSDSSQQEEGSEESKSAPLKQDEAKPAAAQAWKPGFKRRQENEDEDDAIDANALIGEGERDLRPILNRVSEGNIDPMFQKLKELFNKVMTKDKVTKTAYYEAYAKNFITLAISQQQQMNQLLSVNCVFVTALQRLCGVSFFAVVLQRLFKAFKDNHDNMVSKQGVDQETSVMRIKNIMNCLLHLYLF